MSRIFRYFLVAVMLLGPAALTGCSSTPIKKGPSDAELAKDREIAELMEKVNQLKNQTQKVSQEKQGLESAKKELEYKLSKEIGEYKAKLEMTERGLVITFLNEILFDPGKDVIKEAGKTTLMDVAKVLNTNAKSSDVAVEGHTDSQPIKYSGWKSNWELSAARALSVTHFLIEQGGVAPKRLSAVEYSEYRPVATNATSEGQGKNRRVEIVILPANLQKIGK